MAERSTTTPGTPPQAVRTWPKLLNSLVAGRDLAPADTAWAMDQVMSGLATPVQFAGFLVALAAKGETADEISGMATTMLAHAVPVSVPGRVVDVVGTGGDGANTVNVSTMAALVTAAAGVPVVKHGARASSSKCGTADVLEELGVAIGLSAAGVERCVAEVGIGFCFAPTFHPSTRYASAPRRELGIPTAFNLLGPLTNPARPAAGLIGCGFAPMAPLLAQVFADRGATVLVVRGDDRLDEITTTTTTTAWLVQDGTVVRCTIDPVALGMSTATPSDLVGGDAALNAQVVRDLVAGKKGPVRDAVLLNAAGALAAHRGFSGGQDRLADDLLAGLDSAATAIDSGATADLLARWAALSSSLAE